MQTDYDCLNSLSVKERAVLSAMCGNDYTGHLFAFTIGHKSTTGRRGRAFTAMKNYCRLESAGDRMHFLTSLERDNRWSNGDAPLAENFVKKFCKALATVYHYPVYRHVFSAR